MSTARLAAFFHDFLHGVLHFEGKIWRTLPLLAWRPGELTRRYIDGQRARFVSPIALFLFCVFLMFAVMASRATSAARPAGIASDAESKIADSQARDRGPAKHAGRGEQAKADSTAKIDAGIAMPDEDSPMLQRDAGQDRAAPSPSPTTCRPGSADTVEKAAKNPDLLFYKLKTNAYKFSWALIPISVPFVWLLFPFSRRFRHVRPHRVRDLFAVLHDAAAVAASSLVGLVSPAIAGLVWLSRRSTCTASSRAPTRWAGGARSGAPWRSVDFRLRRDRRCSSALLGRASERATRRRRPPVRRSRRPWAAWPSGSTSRQPGSPGPLAPPRSIVSPAITFLISSPDSVSYSSSALASVSSSLAMLGQHCLGALITVLDDACGFPCRSPARSRSTSASGD